MSWLAAGAGFLGSLYQNQEAKRSAKRQMEFQAGMSNTAYQRVMQDMRKAGLNPMLAMKLGGASTPQGAMYTPQNVGKAATDGYLSGAQAQLANAKSQQAQSQIALNESNIAKNAVDMGLTTEKTKQVISQVKKLEQDTEFAKELHSERWERLFSTMGKDNVITAMVAAYNGVPLAKVLKGFPKGMMPKERAALKSAYDELLSSGSLVQREAAGALNITKSAIQSAVKAIREGLDNMLEFIQ